MKICLILLNFNYNIFISNNLNLVLFLKYSYGGNMKNLFLKLLFVYFFLGSNFVFASETIEAFVVNLSEMNSQVKVTDLICDKVLHDDLIDAKSSLSINLCKDEDGLGQVELFIKIGCTKNKTIIKKNVTDGKKIPFLPTK